MKACTDVEQSKKLAKILLIESADFHFAANLSPKGYLEKPIWGNSEYAYYNALPCWSLAALLEIIPNQFDGFQFLLFPCYNSEDWSCCYENEDAGYFDVKAKYITYGESPVDVCVEMIYTLKENNLL